MGRTVKASKRREPPIKPVEKVEVPTKHWKGRLIAAAVFLVIGAAALAYAFSSLTSVSGGWQEISVKAGDDTCAGELMLIYELGVSGQSAKAENTRLVNVYTAACRDAYRIFNASEEFEGVGNLAFLNSHPNEPVELDPALYGALELLTRYGERRIYLGPAYEIYDGVFSCTEDWQTVEFDPAQNDGLRELFAGVAAFASDPESVDIRLLGDGRAELHVSQEYIDFAAEQGLGPYVDLYYLKNAFIVDHVADALVEAGLTRGALSSYDGFARNLDGASGTSYSLNIPAYRSGRAIVAGRFDYHGPMALVTLRDFPAGEMDGWYYRAMPDGSFAHRYLSMADGLPAATAGSVTAYSATGTCAETALMALGVFLDGDDLTSLPGGILVDGTRVEYTDPDAVITELNSGYELRLVK